MRRYLGASVLEPDLDAALRQVGAAGQVCSGIRVRVVALLEQTFQLQHLCWFGCFGHSHQQKLYLYLYLYSHLYLYLYVYLYLYS